MPEQRVNILLYKPDGTLIARYFLGDGEAYSWVRQPKFN